MRRLVCLLSASFIASVAVPSSAHACGGCFQPPDVVSSVTDHRMVIALSNDQSTLWDQIQYNGNPRDFVWVLPTPEPAMVELADPSFFDTLDDRTRPQVIPPPVAQPTNSGPSFGCGSANFAAGARESVDDGVTVHHQGQVGPYETATISSKDPMALVRWCNQQGYAVPNSLYPTVKFYGTTAEGWRALAICKEAGLPIKSLERSWDLDDGEPSGPYWKVVFRRI